MFAITLTLKHYKETLCQLNRVIINSTRLLIRGYTCSLSLRHILSLWVHIGIDITLKTCALNTVYCNWRYLNLSESGLIRAINELFSMSRSCGKLMWNVFWLSYDIKLYPQPQLTMYINCLLFFTPIKHQYCILIFKICSDEIKFKKKIIKT